MSMISGADLFITESDPYSQWFLMFGLQHAFIHEDKLWILSKNHQIMHIPFIFEKQKQKNNCWI